MILFHVRHAVALFFETSLSTCQRHKTQNMVQGTHPQQSTIGINKDMLLILNNNNAAGVTDEVSEITWFYKQR
jgi:hypothetical protein